MYFAEIFLFFTFRYFECTALVERYWPDTVIHENKLLAAKVSLETDAVRIGNMWAIPVDAKKPKDARIRSGKYIKNKTDSE